MCEVRVALRGRCALVLPSRSGEYGGIVANHEMTPEAPSHAIVQNDLPGSDFWARAAFGQVWTFPKHPLQKLCR
jgi:hypothetical protein